MPKLTDRMVKDATTKGSYKDISDAGTPLTLRVTLSGEKLWKWRGRINGQQTKRTIGSYPDMTLFEARTEAMRMRRDAKQAPATLEPVIHPHHRPKGKTVQEALDQYHRVESDHLRSGKDIASNMRRFVTPAIGSKQMKSVVKQDIRDIISKAQETMQGGGVNRLLAQIKRWLNYCVENDLIDVNPALSIVKPAKEVVRDRVIPEHEFGYVKKALPAGGEYANAFGLLLYTMCRRADILELKWSEVEDDKLNIHRTKNGKPFLVYLTDTAKSFLPERPKDAKDDDRVFSHIRADGSGKSLTKFRKKALELAKADGRIMEHFILHDFRDAGVNYLATLLDEQERQLYPPEVRSAMLNHVNNSVTSKHYDRHSYWREKKAAIISWGEALDAS